MHAGLDALEVEVAELVRHRVGAVLEVETHAGEAGDRGIRRLSGVAHRHLAHQQRRAAEQVVAHQHGRAGGVRLRAADHQRGRHVRGAAGRRTRGHLDHVGQLLVFEQGRGRKREQERAGVARHDRVGQRQRVQARRARLVAEAQRQHVAQLEAERGARDARVAGAHVVRQELPDADGVGARGLDQEGRRAVRVQGNVDREGRGCADREGLPARREREREGRPRQGLQLGVRDGRGGDVARRGCDVEPIAAGRDPGEAVAARCEQVDLDAVVRGSARGHRGREHAHPVVAEHGGRKIGRVVDQRDDHPGQGCPALAVEGQRRGTDHGAVRSGVAGVDRIGVGGPDRLVLCRFEHTVAGHDRGRRGLQVAREDAGCRCGLGELDQLAVRGAGDPHQAGLDQPGVQVLIGIGEAQEDRFTLGVLRGGQQVQGTGQADRRAVELGRRGDRGERSSRQTRRATTARLDADADGAGRAGRVPQELDRSRGPEYGDDNGVDVGQVDETRRRPQLIGGRGLVVDRRAGRGLAGCRRRQEHQQQCEDCQPGSRATRVRSSPPRTQHATPSGVATRTGAQYCAQRGGGRAQGR